MRMAVKSVGHWVALADPGDGPAFLFLGQIEARRAEKNFFFLEIGSPLSQGVDDPPPPLPPLSEGLDPP